MTIRQFARRQGVSHSMIRKGIASGRLEESVGYDERGRPFIADVALADREWRINRDPAHARGDREGW